MKSDTASLSSSTSVVPHRTSISLSASSPDRVPLLIANATNDAEDGKLWPSLVEKHFIDVLIDEELKGNMPQGQFKTGLWTSIVRKFNLRVNKNYNKEQLRQNVKD
ncbi:hypothetical protein SO802_028486 [Lithocarpus litseifolius]|uniref:Myb/SANT-like domain-containing protein n=1 Tax=Lithocarpus litseifolius TaxID=425828 RepID=A0AAW2BSX5_9ROSI